MTCELCKCDLLERSKLSNKYSKYKYDIVEFGDYQFCSEKHYQIWKQKIKEQEK